jgi:hypothetical protein
VTKRRPGKTSWSPMPSKVKLGNRVVRHIFYSMVVCIILILLNLWSSSTYETQHWNLFPQNLLSDRRQRARDIDLSMGERDVFCPVFRRKEEGYGNWGVRGGS